eukprot:Blabericola_migrator_1__13475@NODE_976_length_5843_cov_1203_626731_g676_i0_p1_GENE_NODE_976_length_5843_cov_1203_626731_g676_i0NODE_976_length_5843_cov_1203_626731_g676_i0_p1_ORF_typecomplete_len930_score95_59_NODE_976_length_5843_cov_1203_626731_g676_i028335622
MMQSSNDGGEKKAYGFQQLAPQSRYGRIKKASSKGKTPAKSFGASNTPLQSAASPSFLSERFNALVLQGNCATRAMARQRALEVLTDEHLVYAVPHNRRYSEHIYAEPYQTAAIPAQPSLSKISRSIACGDSADPSETQSTPIVTYAISSKKKRAGTHAESSPSIHANDFQRANEVAVMPQVGPRSTPQPAPRVRSRTGHTGSHAESLQSTPANDPLWARMAAPRVRPLPTPPPVARVRSKTGHAGIHAASLHTTPTISSQWAAATPQASESPAIRPRARAHSKPGHAGTYAELLGSTPANNSQRGAAAMTQASEVPTTHAGARVCSPKPSRAGPPAELWQNIPTNDSQRAAAVTPQASEPRATHAAALARSKPSPAGTFAESLRSTTSNNSQRGAAAMTQASEVPTTYAGARVCSPKPSRAGPPAELWQNIPTNDSQRAAAVTPQASEPRATHAAALARSKPSPAGTFAESLRSTPSNNSQRGAAAMAQASEVLTTHAAARVCSPKPGYALAESWQSILTTKSRRADAVTPLASPQASRSGVNIHCGNATHTGIHAQSLQSIRTNESQRVAATEPPKSRPIEDPVVSPQYFMRSKSDLQIPRKKWASINISRKGEAKVKVVSTPRVPSTPKNKSSDQLLLDEILGQISLNKTSFAKDENDPNHRRAVRSRLAVALLNFTENPDICVLQVPRPKLSSISQNDFKQRLDIMSKTMWPDVSKRPQNYMTFAAPTVLDMIWYESHLSDEDREVIVNALYKHCALISDVLGITDDELDHMRPPNHAVIVPPGADIEVPTIEARSSHRTQLAFSVADGAFLTHSKMRQVRPMCVKLLRSELCKGLKTSVIERMLRNPDCDEIRKVGGEGCDEEALQIYALVAVGAYAAKTSEQIATPMMSYLTQYRQTLVNLELVPEVTETSLTIWSGLLVSPA